MASRPCTRRRSTAARAPSRYAASRAPPGVPRPLAGEGPWETRTGSIFLRLNLDTGSASVVQFRVRNYAPSALIVGASRGDRRWWRPEPRWIERAPAARRRYTSHAGAIPVLGDG
jgi:hypothetical protein